MVSFYSKISLMWLLSSPNGVSGQAAAIRNGHSRQQLEVSDIFGDVDLPDVLDGQSSTGSSFTMPDWISLDWNNFSLESVDWKGMEWTQQGWQDFMLATLDGTGETLDVCPILEMAIGIGNSFGIAGECSCEGGLGDETLNITCGFTDLCLEGDAVCASAALNFTVDQRSGAVNTSACLDSSDAGFSEVCFSYKVEVVNVVDDAGNMFDMDQSCDASYDGNACDCEIQQDMCLLIDCSAYLPGAKLDTCQQLAFENTEDALSLFPRFPVFEGAFNGSFAFETIDWANLDWNNIDWLNFGFDQVNWTSVDWTSLNWDSIFGTVMPVEDVCPILTERVLGMGAELIGNCTCNGELASGLKVLCSFEKQCTEKPDDQEGVIAISRIGFPSSTEICGDIDLDLAFDGVGSVSGNLCVDFDEDIHPTTCIKYSIPVADQESLPTCSASYGGEPCACEIDQNLCVKVDCSAYEETAVMDQCQHLSIQRTSDLQLMIPSFDIPIDESDTELDDDQFPEDQQEEPTESPSAEGPTTTSETKNELQNGGSSAFSRSSFTINVLSVISLVVFAFSGC